MNNRIKYFHLLILFSIVHGQPKERIELQINKCSGNVTNSLNGNPIYAIKVEILSGNNNLKDSCFTDNQGNYYIDPVGYVWRPRIRFTSSSYTFKNKIIFLKETNLDNKGILKLDVSLDPVPEDEKPKVFSKGTIDSRAKTFFWEGNVFYYLDNNSNANDYKASKFIIKKVDTDISSNGDLILWINNKEINPLLCYVPQNGNYENLLSILGGYLSDPLYKTSGLPRFLDKSVLEPTVVFGKITDAQTNEPVIGAEISIVGINTNKRITSIDGKYAFQIPEVGNFVLKVIPPMNSKYEVPSDIELIIKEARGGWHQSNQRLIPKRSYNW